MPEPTSAPLVLAVGLALLAAGVATSMAFLVVGAVLFAIGLAMWISQLLPGRGHEHIPKVAPEHRPQPVQTAAGRVQRLQEGTPGYRLRLPVKFHPVSAGIKGGLIGGLVMPLPALAFGVLSGHGIWWPINLLGGMALPSVGSMPPAELEQFRPALLILGISIHLMVSLIVGLLYGVLMPTLPEIPKPVAWGAVLMPLLWTAASFIGLSMVSPGVRERIEWPWFVISQLAFGIIAALVFMCRAWKHAPLGGLIAGAVGGTLMPIPTLIWSLASGHGLWYPVNLLSAMAMRHEAALTLAELEQFHESWFLAAVFVHAILSLSFGLAFALVLPRVPAIPGPFAWGGLLMPLFWTALSYGMMGVVNPVLQERVNWPWFIASQFVFGLAAAFVVVRSEEVYIAPAGHGPEHPADERTN